MSGKKQREVRQWERRREGEEEETSKKRTINLPLSIDRKIEDAANASQRTFSEVVREQLGAANAKLTPGPKVPRLPAPTTYNRIAFSTVAPEDLPLPIDTRNTFAMCSIMCCIGGRWKHGTQLYPTPRRGSGYLPLFDEPGQQLCMYHIPFFDTPGQEHQIANKRFNALCRLLISLAESPSEMRAHPDYLEWKKLEDNLYNINKPSVTTLLIKSIWLEFCYSMIRWYGHSTPRAFVSMGQYDEKLKKHDMWIAPGSKFHVDSEKDVLPYEILQRKLQKAS